MLIKTRPSAFVIAFVLSLPLFAATPAPYLSDSEVDLAFLLPPPPARGSAEEKAEIDEMLRMQKERTPAQIVRSTEDAHFTVFRFSDVLGPNFTKDKLPVTSAFFDRITSSTFSLMMAVKEHWNRPRPFETISTLKPEQSLKDALIEKKTGRFNASYPSGHALSAVLWAILLGDVFPDKRAELFKRAYEYGHNRVVGLVHYPSDTNAGKQAGAVLAFALMRHEEFRSDFEKAKAELRSVVH